MRSLRCWTAAALAAPVLALTGCGGGDDGAAAGSTSGSTSSGSASSAPATSSAAESSGGSAGSTTAAPSGPSVEVPAEYGGVTLPLPPGASVASAAVDPDGRAYVVTLTGVTGQAGYEFYREAFPAAGYQIEVDVAQATNLQAEDAEGADVGYNGFLDEVELRFNG